MAVTWAGYTFIIVVVRLFRLDKQSGPFYQFFLPSLNCVYKFDYYIDTEDLYDHNHDENRLQDDANQHLFLGIFQKCFSVSSDILSLHYLQRRSIRSLLFRWQKDHFKTYATLFLWCPVITVLNFHQFITMVALRMRPL